MNNNSFDAGANINNPISNDISETEVSTIWINFDEVILFNNDQTKSFKIGAYDNTPARKSILLRCENINRSLIEQFRKKGISDNQRIGSFSIRYVTRILMDEDLTPDIDIYGLWYFRGRKLSTIIDEYEMRKLKTGMPKTELE